MVDTDGKVFISRSEMNNAIILNGDTYLWNHVRADDSPTSMCLFPSIDLSFRKRQGPSRPILGALPSVGIGAVNGLAAFGEWDQESGLTYAFYPVTVRISSGGTCGIPMGTTSTL
jgi:hypothetical protein